MSGETYEPGELFVYTNGDRWELGQVKRPNNDGTGYFCWYTVGDTAANTPVERMHKLANAGWSHVEGELSRFWEKAGEVDGLYAQLKRMLEEDAA